MEAATQKELSGEKASRIVEAMHYYFGTKEALLVEVVRRDAEHRIARLDEPLGKAASAEEILQILVADLQDSIQNEPGFWVLLFDLFTAGRRNPEIQREVGELFNRTRAHVADIFRAKEREGVISMRFEADAVVGFLFSVADGIALQMLSDPKRDHADVIAAGTAAAKYLLSAD